MSDQLATYFQIQNETSVAPSPGPRQVWRHLRTGSLYAVLLLTSEPDFDKENQFPVQVVYQGLNDGRTWARLRSHFCRTFEFVGDYNDSWRENVRQTVPNVHMADFDHIWHAAKYV